MIEPVEWNDRHLHRGQPKSSFARGLVERRLHVTLHSETLTDLTPEDNEAVALLRDLGRLPVFRFLESRPGSHPHLEIDAADEKQALAVTIDYGQTRQTAWDMQPSQLRAITEHLLERQHPEEGEFNQVLSQLIVASAH